MASREWSGAVRFGLPGLFLGLAAAWTFGGGAAPSVKAQGAGPGAMASEAPRMVPGMAASADTIAFAVASPGSPQLFYLIDTRNQAFAIYRVDTMHPKGAVKLEAARQYRYDLKLAEFNNQAPEVAAIESMVKALGRK